MTTAAAPSAPPGLFVGDGDELDLVDALEASFRLDFTDAETTGWITLGDVHRTLVDRIPATSAPGLCATSMAFYRLRAVLTALGAQGRIRTSTPLKRLVAVTPKRLAAEVAARLGVSTPALDISVRGAVGSLFLLAGICAGIWSATDHAAWPSLVAIPLGLALLYREPGSYGRRSVGALAREIAFRNHARFAEQGADTGANSLWRALVELVADNADADPHDLVPETRLLPHPLPKKGR
jgi:hypothetical protein